MLIPIITGIGILIGCYLHYIKGGDRDIEWVAAWWWFCGWTIIILWSMTIAISSVHHKAKLEIIDQKIAVTEQINEERIDSVFPILEKYPELEREIIENIDPRQFAILGEIYPNLKSDKAYQTQATIVLQNLQKVEDLRIEKLDLEGEVLFFHKQLFLI